MIFLLAALMLFAAGITACKSSDEPGGQDIDIKQEAGSISSRREGVYSQSIPSPGIFAASDRGIYVLNSVPEGRNGRKMLLYSDFGTDAFVYVCSRPDCAHADETCDACLSGADAITYVNDHIYYAGMFARSKSDLAYSFKIMCADPDGRNHAEVIDIGASERFRQGSLGFAMFSDGVFYFDHEWLDENGTQHGQRYYYRLDGSMQAPEAVDAALVYGNDGAATFFWIPTDPNEYYTWDSQETALKLVFTLDPETSCYMAEKNAYIMTDNKIYRKDYDTGEETLLFDTGLSGTHRMRCFPDCIAIIDGVAFDGSEPEIEQQTLRFYSWEFEPLGEITLDYAILQGRTSPICAETPGKLLLSTDYRFLPQYYIDKAELGTGNLTLHELKLPEAMLGE